MLLRAVIFLNNCHGSSRLPGVLFLLLYHIHSDLSSTLPIFFIPQIKEITAHMRLRAVIS